MEPQDPDSAGLDVLDLEASNRALRALRREQIREEQQVQREHLRNARRTRVVEESPLSSPDSNPAYNSPAVAGPSTFQTPRAEFDSPLPQRVDPFTFQLYHQLQQVSPILAARIPLPPSSSASEATEDSEDEVEWVTMARLDSAVFPSHCDT